MPASRNEVHVVRPTRSRLAFLGCTVLVSLIMMSLPVLHASGSSTPPGLADAAPPVGEIEYPPVDGWVAYRYPAVRVRFSDPDGIETSSLAIQVDGTPLTVSWYGNAADGELYGGGGPLAEGPHAAEARAMDRLGNGPTVLSWPFSVDTIQPVVNITDPSGNPELADGSLTLAWTGSDAGSGIDHYWIRIDDGPYFNVGGVTSFPFHDLAPGIHYFYVAAVDVAGNGNYNYYSGEVVAIATVPRPPSPPENTTTQVLVTIPDAVPSWAVALVAVNAAEAVAVASLVLRRRREFHGSDSQRP